MQHRALPTATLLSATLLSAILLLTLPKPAWADGAATQIAWKGWRVESSEALWAGRKHRAYPLTHLLDGDPKTAWVFSGLGKRSQAGFRGRHSLIFRPEKAFRLDTIRLMNGYNKDLATYRRNHRATGIDVYVSGRKVTSATLPDRMGWHAIRLPGGAVSATTVELVITRLAKGTDDDVCLSEVAFSLGGKDVDMSLPRWVLFSAGSEGALMETSLIDRDGKALARGDTNGDPVWNRSGKRVAGVERGGARDRLWVADAVTGRWLHREDWPAAQKKPASPFDLVPYEIRWHGDGRLTVSLPVEPPLRKEVRLK